MKTEEVIVNRQNLWLTFDTYKRIDNQGLYEDVPEKITVFYNSEEPKGVSHGKQLKNAEGEVVFFNNLEEARDQTINYLKRIIYPPNFLPPMDYRSSSTLPEIMFKNLKFDLGPANSENMKETIEGRITHCLTTSGSYEYPYSLTIEDVSGRQRRVRMMGIKNIHL